ncbi:hypothetical protein LCI18_008492 [Fusarium solani-melongenae]|uniref:Uncharacterized protein n=1 Tax=Fusarium solani subsp. cucurbitae TaxID=2747967 RepID=A0ACD3Z8U9_FUSSC|nr:hypothetical protein LCI18_008492 [Fusarium solani-melongenae]
MTTDSDNETQNAEEKHKLAMSELKVKLQSPDYRRDVANMLLSEKQYLSSETFVGYFYFSHGLQEPHNSLLRALLEQFMDQNAVLLSELLDKNLHAYADGIRETEMLQKLVKRAIETRRTTFLVLDGLDEYTHKELDRTVEWLLFTAKSLPNESILRIIISTRCDSTGLH